MNSLRVAMLGYGTVARALVAMLAELAPRLREERGVSFSFTAALTGRHGGWLHAQGLGPEALHASGWPGGAVPPGAKPFSDPAVDFIAACEADVLVEATPLSPLDGEPARTHLQTALQRGMHAVTANKGPIAHALGPLRALARAKGRALRYESTVMDGAPLFILRERCLPGTRVVRVRGVLNATSSHVSERLAHGDRLEAAIRDAQRLGIAEAEPAHDLDGWDSAVKAAVLANALMDGHLRPQDVRRQGCGPEALREMVAGVPPGTHVRQLVEIDRTPAGSVSASVRVTSLKPGSVLASLRGMETAITLSTDTMQELTIVEGEGGPGQTAFGLITDLLEVAALARPAAPA
ncbi:MAG TPA: homoserine dehydrogenase [Myxococcaceae bacterium]|nr:homoserine dehydrogenase [Myxococcaceae bacterium]